MFENEIAIERIRSERFKKIELTLEALADELRRLKEYQDTCATKISIILNKRTELDENLNFHSEQIESLWKLVGDLSPKLEPKKPYKCPVCAGQARMQVDHGRMEPFEKRIIDSQGRHFLICHACEGKGIIWG